MNPLALLTALPSPIVRLLPAGVRASAYRSLTFDARPSLRMGVDRQHDAAAVAVPVPPSAATHPSNVAAARSIPAATRSDAISPPASDIGRAPLSRIPAARVPIFGGDRERALDEMRGCDMDDER